jgi:hypothetical protein
VVSAQHLLSRETSNTQTALNEAIVLKEARPKSSLPQLGKASTSRQLTAG